MNSHIIEHANALIEALPYIQKFRQKTIVVKYGGNAMTNEVLKEAVLKDVVLLALVGIHVVVVHGGGPEINRWLDRLKIKHEFIDGLRKTDAETMEVVEMVLAGKVGKDLVSRLNQLGAKAISLSGKDGSLIQCQKKLSKTGADIGFVGEVTSININVLNVLQTADYIPVISSIGVDNTGQSYNINADNVAAHIAIALGAEKLMLLTDVDGVLDKEKNLIEELTLLELNTKVADGTITGGMLPKIECAVDAVKFGVPAVHILNGTVPHSILLELFTDHGVGTLLRKDQQ